MKKINKKAAIEIDIVEIVIFLALIISIILIIGFTQGWGRLYNWVFTNDKNVKFNIYERQYTNYTVEQDVENHSIISYNQTIVFELAPIEEYSINEIVYRIPLFQHEPICDSNSQEYKDKFCGGQYGSCTPDVYNGYIKYFQQLAGCFDNISIQRILDYRVINNSNIRQVDDALKNLDTKRQNITIIVQIENDTLYYTKVNVTETNFTDSLIYGNVIKNYFFENYYKIILDKDFLNEKAECLNYYCPEGYERSTDYSKDSCYKCEWSCQNGWGKGDNIPLKCNKWLYEDKYVIEEAK